MKIALLGATGSVSGESLAQRLDAGHELCVLVRNRAKLPAILRERVRVVEGDEFLHQAPILQY